MKYKPGVILKGNNSNYVIARASHFGYYLSIPEYTFCSPYSNIFVEKRLKLITDIFEGEWD